MDRLLTWIGKTLFPAKHQAPPQKPRLSVVQRRAAAPANPVRETNQPSAQDKQPDLVDLETELGGRIEDAGPGKNVLVRSKYLREDTGTHEKLKIVDDSLSDDGDVGGFDPYNTGQFDRSKNWNTWSRKK